MIQIRAVHLDFIKHDFILIGSDGLYESMSNQEIVDFIHQNMSEMGVGQQDTQKVVDNLVQYCLKSNIDKNKQSDNISAIIIPLSRCIIKDGN